MKKRRLVVVTFGGGSESFRLAAQRVQLECSAVRMVSETVVESDVTLRSNHPDFWARWGEFMYSNSKVFGFGIWKPYLIRHYLNQIDDETDLLYLDAGCVVNSNPKSAENWMRLVGALENTDVLSTELTKRHFGWPYESLAEASWTKRQLIEQIGAGQGVLDSPQRQSGVLLFRPSHASRRFAREWWDLSSADNGYFISEKDADRDQSRQFIAHRHEQSTFSVLSKINGFNAIPDNTWHAPLWHWKGRSEPIWAPRWRRGDPFSPFRVPVLANELSTLGTEMRFQVNSLKKSRRTIG